MDSNIISENRIESDSEYVKLEKACDMLSEKLDCDISVIYSHKSSIYKFVKRAFDITASLLAIVVLFPIFLISAIAIKLEDGAPVIFAAMRCGKDMKPFKMFKFRSMCVNAEEMLSDVIKEEDKNGLAYKIENDPRITKVGRFIRKTSIDELPQLINIIHCGISCCSFNSIDLIFFDLFFLFAKLGKGFRIKIVTFSLPVLPAVIIRAIAPLPFALSQNSPGFIFPSGLCHNNSSLLFLVWALSQ